jgi:lactoylglutathione lyase
MQTTADYADHTVEVLTGQALINLLSGFHRHRGSKPGDFAFAEISRFNGFVQRQGLNRYAGAISYAMVKKLLHTRYRVHDLEKTVSFYKDVLGLQEIRRHTSGRGSQLVFLKAPGNEEEIEICKFDESGPIVVGPDLTHLAFEVDDLDMFAQHAAAKGYPLSDGPHSTNGGRIAFIDAPEGYEIELIERGKK